MATLVPFDPGKVDDDALRRTDLVRAKFNEAVLAVNARDGEIKRLEGVTVDLQARVAEAQKAVVERSDELQATRKELALQAGRVQALSEQLKTLELSPAKIGVQDLVSQFKGNIDRINAEVIDQKTPGMLVDSVEVEVRGGIDLQDGLHITQLPASALGAQSVSLLKFNLRSASALKIVDDDG